MTPRFLAALLLLALPVCHAGQEDIYLITHQKSLQATLTSKKARSIFSMRLRRWPDQSAIRVFVLPDEHPLHINFLEKKLRLFPHQLRRSWDRYIYTGTGQAPIQVSSEEEMLARVASTPGAIGYMSMPENLPSSQSTLTKVQRIELE